MISDEVNEPAVNLSKLTKSQLLDYAEGQGVTASSSMTKAQIIETIEAAQ